MATTVAKLKTGVGDMKPTVSICALIPLLALGGHQLIRCTCLLLTQSGHCCPIPSIILSRYDPAQG